MPRAETTVETPPTLESGDRLTRVEFERRYDAMPDLKKAELIGGVVHVGSPVRLIQHGQPHGVILTWLGVYWGSTPGLFFGDNVSIRLDDESMPQPDAILMARPEWGGRARVGPDDYVEGGPELVVEVAASTAGVDLHAKLDAYRRNGVREYIAWRVPEGAVDWLVLRGEQYARLEPGEDGICRSEAFPGLWLDPAALVAGDLAGVLEVLRLGLADPAHRAFAGRLGPPAA